MRSPFKLFHFVLMTTMLLLPLGCNSSSETGDATANADSQPSVANPVGQTSQDIERQVMAQSARQTDVLNDAAEPVVIELPKTVAVTPQVLAKPAIAATPAIAKVAPVAVESLEVAAIEDEEADTPAENEPAAVKQAQPAAPIQIFSGPSVPEVKDIDENATHYQAGLIEVSKGAGDPHKINAFCLDSQGQIIAACGEGPGEIRILDADGKLLTSWKVEIKPEAVNIAKNGTILVGGHGKLMRFSPAGKLMASADAPHAESIRKNKAKMREEVVQQLQNRSGRSSLAARVRTYESIIKQLEDRQNEGKLGAQEEQILASLPKTLEIMKKQLAEQGEEGEEPKVNEAQVDAQVKSMMDYKMRISSISADSEHVFVATYAMEGYSFEVWQLDQDFKNGKVVVDNLRGCCGQMDVQVNDNGIFVAENARYRVACFDSKGELKTSWGKGDRTGADGFTSCCNPMNVCFNKNGDVYTAESNTGRIKRFSADGELKDFIGDVKLVPGCKNVSIAVSPDGDRVYMLDITRNHIVLMKKKSEKPQEEKTPKVTSRN